ncbi:MULTISPECIES: DivIVA domain-containing protein [Actinokineospora]|uniref:Cell wall synthesis protein Wag31 n=2 Tax=Actinokineospora TaxID=39845 RepID=A0A421B5M7_9PSEU|nr:MULTISPECIES: DivIVA domain-containing protein [Actinokineospora]RLK59540.1 DivIVA domain-containing protein [Actinokineospora cianjurensis]SES10686.1 DivIVA domain-containing protein [Actinokineospora terrae]
MSLTPDAVRAVTFDKAPFGKRGYHEDQVDAFLDKVEAALEGRGKLTVAEVREAEFDAAPLVKRGYNEDQVDEFLDSVAVELESRAAEDALKVIPANSEAPYLPLPPAPPGTRGYHPTDVERLAHLLDRAANEHGAGPSADQVENLRLGLSAYPGQGYHPAAVDAIKAAWLTELRRR